MKIAIGSDKSGFPLKEAVKGWLEENGYDFVDLGTLEEDNVIPYYEAAPLVSETVASGEADRGILCCGTGMGMSIVANKRRGVRAACCESVYAAKMCRAVNDANVLCMGGWLIAPWMGIEMARTFLSTDFTQDLEDWRAPNLRRANATIADYESRVFADSERSPEGEDV